MTRFKAGKVLSCFLCLFYLEGPMNNVLADVSCVGARVS